MDHSVEELELENGAKGLLIDLPQSPVVDYEVAFRSGYVFTDPGQYDAPHLMEHLLLGANREHPDKHEYNFALEKNGAWHNAYTNFYHNTYVAEAAEFEYQRILSLLLSGINQPLFLESEYQSELETVKEELVDNLDNYSQKLTLLLEGAMGGKKLGYQTRLDSITNLTLSKLKKYHKATHTPANCNFLVAGDLENKRDTIQQLLETELAALPPGKRFQFPDEEFHALDEPYLIPEATDKLYFKWNVFRDRRISELEKRAFTLARKILAGYRNARIRKKARKRGLIYNFRCNGGHRQAVTRFGVEGRISYNKAEQFFTVMAEEVQRLLDGDLDREELEMVKKIELGQIARSYQTSAHLMGWYSNNYLRYDLIESFQVNRESIQSVESHDVVEVFRDIFADGIQGLGLLGEQNKVSTDSLAEICDNIIAGQT